MKKKSKPVFNGAEAVTALVYICAISASLMHILCKEHMAVCTAVMTTLSFGIYTIFYALRKKKALSLLTFTALFFSVYFVSGAAIGPYGASSFMEFIFTASDFFDPVLAGVTIAVFSLIIGFTICYFSVYLPRPSFLLLPAFIPLILAARTLGGLPAGLLVFLAVGYMLAAAGIARPEYPADNAYVDYKRAHMERLAALGVFGLASALLLTVIPRDDKTPMLRYLDTVLLSQRTALYGVQSLSGFRETAQPNHGNNRPTSNALFLVSTSAPRNVSEWSYDLYNGEEGWSIIDDSEYTSGYRDWEKHRRMLNADTLISDLKRGVREGKLAEYRDEINRLDDIPEELYNAAAQMTVRVVDGSNTNILRHPARVIGAHITGYSEEIYRTVTDVVYTSRNFGKDASYVMEFFVDEPNAQFIEMLERIDLNDLLLGAYLDDVIDYEVYSEFRWERMDAEDYHELTRSSGVTPEIKALADEITAGLSNNCEKARAIESWFGEAGFVYDLDFVPERAEADYFLFESKRGICTDFATAATLLLRAADIPARYTQGFVIDPASRDDYGRFIVTAAQAHAYASAYIDGYGWLEIDGTKYVSEDAAGEKFAAVTLAVLLAGGVLAALAIIFRERLSEAVFAVRYSLKDKRGRIRAVYLRTRALACRISGADPKCTAAEEVRDIISRTLSLDEEAREITGAANELFYGGREPIADDKRLYEDYKTICRMKRSKKK